MIKNLNFGRLWNLFVPAAIGQTIGSTKAVIEALFSVVGPQGLIGMLGFSADAYFLSEIERTDMKMLLIGVG